MGQQAEREKVSGALKLCFGHSKCVCYYLRNTDVSTVVSCRRPSQSGGGCAEEAFHATATATIPPTTLKCTLPLPLQANLTEEPPQCLTGLILNSWSWTCCRHGNDRSLKGGKAPSRYRCFTRVTQLASSAEAAQDQLKSTTQVPLLRLSPATSLTLIFICQFSQKEENVHPILEVFSSLSTIWLERKVLQ